MIVRAQCLIASEIDNPIPIRPEAEYGIFAQGDYKWETAEKPGASAGMGTVGRDRGAAKRKKKEEKEAKRLAKKSKKNGDSGASTPPDVEIEAAKPFELNNIDLKVPRGAFVVVVGRVGSGKSSLVQALIGEMQQTRGESYLGGSTSYFPQAPWVQNATLRDNIVCFRIDLCPSLIPLTLCYIRSSLETQTRMRSAFRRRSRPARSSRTLRCVRLGYPSLFSLN